MPILSVIITAKNSARTLPVLLESLKEQTFGNFEVIVVDNWSKDETIEIAKKFWRLEV